MKKLTQAAQAAKLIKLGLKKKYPLVKFSVKSDNYAGGDAVRIDYIDGPITSDVDALVKQFQYGSFDGMTDCYNFTNNREDIPQAKYVQVQRSISPENKEKIKADIMQRYGMTDWNNEACQKVFRSWPEQVIWREACKRAF